MSNSVRKHLLATTLLAGAVSFAAPAFAQTATPANPPVAGSNSAPDGIQSSDSAPTAPDSAGAIVVTGSLIHNPNLVSVAPVTVISQNEIQLRQSYNAESLIREIPGVVPSIGSQVNNGNGGASFANLRGLGYNRNIVLLDGNRIVPANFVGAVDLNNIPLALVERVDVLTGGASTTYGADAISGVVNFITRSDFAGVDATVQQGITQQGDGYTLRADATVGGNFADDKGNAVFSVGYQRVDAIYQGDRDFSNIAIDSFNGTGVAGSGGSGTTTPSRLSLGAATRQIDPTSGSLVPTYARYNFNPFNIFQTPYSRFNMYGAAHYDITDDITFYTRGLFSKNEVSTIVAPSGVFGSSVTINYSNPYLPAAARQQFCASAANNGGVALTAAQCAAAATAAPTLANGAANPAYRTFTTNLSRRTPETGNRVSKYTTTLFDYRAGLRGNFGDHIHWDIAGSYGESENVQATSGYVLTSRSRQALLATNTATCITNTNGCVPLNIFGPTGSITAAQAGFLTASSTITERSTLAQVHGQITGDIPLTVPMASNPITFALGGEYRRYGASQRSDSLAQSGDLGGFGSAPPNFFGAYSVYEGFGELVAPIVQDQPFFKDLEVQAGVRRSQYRIETTNAPTFGTTTYKAGANWTPVESIKLRGDYQHAVRAPNIGELFTPLQTGLSNNATDPCAGAAPAANANLAAICRAQGAPANSIGQIEVPSAGQVNFTSGGNPNLKPEKSNSFTGGVVLQPTFLHGFTLTIDYYDIKVTHAITTPTPADLLNACFGNITAASATSTACTVIRRDPVTGQLSGDTTTVAGLLGNLSNLGKLHTNGIDLTANYTYPLSFGKLNLSFAGNWTDHNKFQATPTSLNRDCVGYYSVNCASIQPKFSWNQRTTLTVKDIDFSVLWRHISHERQEPDDALNGNGPAFVGVPSGLIGSTTSYNFGKIKAYNYIDFAVRAGVTTNFDMVVTMTNAFNKKPPFVGYDIGATAYNSGNTYPSTYDPLGRAFSVAAHLKF